MTFILGSQRMDVGSVVAAFDEYRRYLESYRGRFPPSAWALATSDWYFDFTDHRCPHDGHLQSVKIKELEGAPETGGKLVSIKVHLRGAYGDGDIEFRYPRVYSYRLTLFKDYNYGSRHGHADWLYDEFRWADERRVMHEIEWAGAADTAHWFIEASDVIFRWSDSTT